MSDFDLEKSLREEISGLADIHLSINRQASNLEKQVAELEVARDAIKKLAGYAAIELDRKRKVLADLLARAAE